MRKLNESDLTIVIDHLIKRSPTLIPSLSLLNKSTRTAIQRIQDTRVDIVLYCDVATDGDEAEEEGFEGNGVGLKVIKYEGRLRGVSEPSTLTSTRKLIIRPPTFLELNPPPPVASSSGPMSRRSSTSSAASTRPSIKSDASEVILPSALNRRGAVSAPLEKGFNGLKTPTRSTFDVNDSSLASPTPNKVNGNSLAGGSCEGSDSEAGSAAGELTSSILAGLVKACEGCEVVEYSSACGLSNEVWQEIISLPNLLSLTLKVPPTPITPSTSPQPTPSRHSVASPNPSTPSQAQPKSTPKPIGTAQNPFPRYTPFFLKPIQHPESRRGSPLPEEGVGSEGKGSGAGEMDVEERMLGSGLRVLRVENLSQIGTKNLIHHLINLSTLSTHPPLADLNIDTVFFDAALCTSIATLGAEGGLKHLTVGTPGTKLTGEGMREMVEGCAGLESLVLRDVEGRLPKNMWKDIKEYPKGLTEFSFELSENDAHHSWVLDHFQSLTHLPIKQLQTFRIHRLVPELALMPFVPSNIAKTQIPRIDSVAQPEPLPEELLKVLLDDGKKLKTLELDWWDVDDEQLGRLTKGMSGVEELGLRLKTEVLETIGLTNFGGAAKLLRFNLTLVPADELPWDPDNTKVKSRITKTAPLKIDYIPPEIPSYVLENLPSDLLKAVTKIDISIPANSRMKRMMRKLPGHLAQLQWTGRGGKGCWYFTKAGRDAEKKVIPACVDFDHAATRYEAAWRELEGPRVVYRPLVEQDIPISDVPPPSIPASGSMYGDHPELSMLSPMTNASTVGSEDFETPLLRWRSNTSFPSTGGRVDPKFAHELDDGEIGLGFEQLSLDPGKKKNKASTPVQAMATPRKTIPAASSVPPSPARQHQTPVKIPGTDKNSTPKPVVKSHSIAQPANIIGGKPCPGASGRYARDSGLPNLAIIPIPPGGDKRGRKRGGRLKPYLGGSLMGMNTQQVKPIAKPNNLPKGRASTPAAATVSAPVTPLGTATLPVKPEVGKKAVTSDGWTTVPAKRAKEVKKAGEAPVAVSKGKDTATKSGK